MPEHAKHAVPRGEGRTEVRLHRFGRIRTASVAVPVSSWRPEVWLRDAPDRARGAWCGEDGWAVHGGHVLRLSSDGSDRFRHIRELSRARMGCGTDEPKERERGPESHESPLPRFYGGFSYGSSDTGLWADFGGAHFVVPEWEIRRSGSRTFLLAHSLVDGSETGEADGSLEEEILRHRSRLLEGVTGPDGTAAPEPGGLRPAPVEERARWENHVEAALEEIRAGRLRKVVLARSAAIPSSLTPLEALAALRSRMPGPGTFLVQPGPRSAFVGSSPELLADLRGTRFTATAVAGSADRDPDAASDRAREKALLESGKDRREQAIVAEEIQERLAEVATAVRISDPDILRLPDILHLESRIEARLPGPRHVLDLLARIHPTPAVCGRPRPQAESFLREHESMDRGWYAGPMGWFDASGNGSFSPGLRSGLWTGDHWRIFAGAGIVSGSRPEREWRETELKLEAIRRGFGLTGS